MKRFPVFWVIMAVSVVCGVGMVVIGGGKDQRPAAERTADSLVGLFPTSTITVAPSPPSVPTVMPTSDLGAITSDLTTLYSAYSACQEFVKDRLKAPSTASFPSFLLNSDEIRYSQTGEHITLAAWVDAQNAFGAMLRTNFTCEVKHIDDSWRLEQVKFEKEPN